MKAWSSNGCEVGVVTFRVGPTLARLGGLATMWNAEGASWSSFDLSLQ